MAGKPFGHLPILSDRGTPPPHKVANVDIVLEAPYDALPRAGVHPATDQMRIAGFGFPMDVNRRSVTSLYRAPKTLAQATMAKTSWSPMRWPSMSKCSIRLALAARADRRSVGAERSRLRRGYDHGDRLRGLCGFGLWILPDDPPRPVSRRFRAAHRPSLAWCSRWPAATLRPVRSMRIARGRGITSGMGWTTNGDGTADEGTDGFDNDGTNGVDDVGERETSPPYPVPLPPEASKSRSGPSIPIRVRSGRPPSCLDFIRNSH